ncbi:hypothetical protein PHLGIDRAFT_123031 [Phlebiopsis gigantea 11061_1 CR5-6]|uniref:Uncharacterized protein n=1 Tax=Phlebiopsis gigantea (strain 11061_1 CR5-6) TaxID=745531 RepID=A0A0C3RQ61_PHLG1|nr:hypothetical protein PHLGIDRAFT_123031 [Phlebiopsis gigantea 11061_1 CR5-6]
MLRQEFRDLEVLDEVTKLKYLKKLPLKVTGADRYQLIHSYRMLKGESYQPSNIPSALRWDTDSAEAEYPIHDPVAVDDWIVVDKKGVATKDNTEAAPVDTPAMIQASGTVALTDLSSTPRKRLPRPPAKGMKASAGPANRERPVVPLPKSVACQSAFYCLNNHSTALGIGKTARYIQRLISSADGHDYTRAAGFTTHVQGLYDSIHVAAHEELALLAKYPPMPWDHTVSCRTLANVLATVQTIERRITDIAPERYTSKQQADDAIHKALYEVPGPPLLPSSPWIWIANDAWPDMIRRLQLEYLLGPYLMAYWRWYTGPFDTKSLNDLIGYWKQCHLQIPGSNVFRHIRAVDLDDFLDDQGVEISAQRAYEAIIDPAAMVSMPSRIDIPNQPFLEVSTSWVRRVHDIYDPCLGEYLDAALAAMKPALYES